MVHLSAANSDDVDALVKSIESSIDPSKIHWPGGYPGEIEAALLDAVFTVQSRSGAPNSDVGRVVERWRAWRGDEADDLLVLASQMPAGLASLVDNHARAGGRLKAEIAIHAAEALTRVGLRHSDDFTGSHEQKHAYLSVAGCGPVTWSYFGMLLGRPGVKADTWIRRFVGAAVGREVTPDGAEALVSAAASKLQVAPERLDHAIWLTAREH